MSSESERASQVADLAQRLTVLCTDYEQVRLSGSFNQQFLAASGYLHRAQIHLANAATDYQRGDDLGRDTYPGPTGGGRGRSKADRGPAGSDSPAAGPAEPEGVA